MEENEIQDYIPVRRANQLVIKYDESHKNYIFTDNDLKFLLKRTKDEKVLQKIVKNIERNKNLNPFYDSWKKTVGKFFLYLVFIIVFFILFYLQIGLFIFFLGDPVIQFMYIYFILYQFWWRGGRVSIGLILEYGKTRPMEKYLKSQNRNYFGQRGLYWSLGGGGLWIQVDQNEI
ncbi:hypothetical protein pb186bvf_003799 [Paramecium bursaria]